MHVLLSGGSGFLGSALARAFAGRGNRVTVLLRPGSSLRRLDGLAGSTTVVRYASDEELRAAVFDAQADLIVHTACSYGRAGEPALAVLDANCRFGLALLEAAIAANTPSFINTDTVLDPSVGAYALSKKQFAEWGRWFAERGGIRFVNVLLQHMYGPGDDPSKFTTHVLHACHEQRPTLDLTAGEQRRDFIYLDDVVSAYLLLADRAAGLPPYHDVAVGSGEAPTVREFVRLVHTLTGSRTELRFGALPYRANEAMLCRADLAALRALGWRPAHSLEAGLKETIAREFHQ